MSERSFVSVVEWLSGLENPLGESSPSLTTPPPNPTGKYHHPLSPPESRKRYASMATDPDLTPKRRRVALPAGHHLEGTPRANSVRDGIPNLPTASPSRSDRSESWSESQASGRSSPLKRMVAMELAPNGLETKRMESGDPGMPSALAQFSSELDMSRSPLSSLFAFHVRFPADRDQYGPTPSLDRVDSLVKKSVRCQDSQQDESGWNMLVHCPLLEQALDNIETQNQSIGFEPCTTAKIIQEYLPTGFMPKMVDFCMYVDIGTDKATRDVSKRLRQELPCGVINHTEFHALRQRPITVSIETKTPRGAQPAAAELQISTWHAAQWRLLEDLVARTGGSFVDLTFLPAVIVNGDEWSFAATTREEQNTVLWLEKSSGRPTAITECIKRSGDCSASQSGA
ncbi:hypothetical protein N7508_011231 [Penicillium antarcticum]|uniref:uncharacterized protein n=1 Tax=Penicillium antarcticum TaxID=416450 RepID=UPI002383EC14|nr:uncharacterized protein N7508_011231 [Penicillium antarcticum]KAJ5288456.1 hypothetical protein N7508_011231 [Penicillium antarcticum]